MIFHYIYVDFFFFSFVQMVYVLSVYNQKYNLIEYFKLLKVISYMVADANFSIKCGGQEMRGSDGIVYEAKNSSLGPATFLVMSTEKWEVSNVGLFADIKSLGCEF